MSRSATDSNCGLIHNLLWSSGRINKAMWMRWWHGVHYTLEKDNVPSECSLTTVCDRWAFTVFVECVYFYLFLFLSCVCVFRRSWSVLSVAFVRHPDGHFLVFSASCLWWSSFLAPYMWFIQHTTVLMLWLTTRLPERSQASNNPGSLRELSTNCKNLMGFCICVLAYSAWMEIRLEWRLGLNGN